MRTTLNEAVSVSLVFDHTTGRAAPKRLTRQGRTYTITQVGLHHTYRRGRTLVHVFSVTDGNTFFRLEMDAETLHWVLTEVSDGQPD